MNEWAILDDDGIMHQGDEDFIRDEWRRHNDSPHLYAWKGDLRLVEIHAVHR